MDNNTHGAPHDGARGDARKRHVEGLSDFDALREYAEAERERANRAEQERDDLRLAMQADEARTVSRILYKQAADRAEHAEERLLELENAINWHTSCLNCSSLLDKNYEQYARAEKAEAALTDLRERVRALAEAWEHPVEGRALRLSAAPRLRALLDDGSAS